MRLWARPVHRGRTISFKISGYLDNPTESALCRHCPVAVGDEYYNMLNMGYDNRWRDVWFIFVFFGAFYPPSPQCIRYTDFVPFYGQFLMESWSSLRQSSFVTPGGNLYSDDPATISVTFVLPVLYPVNLDGHDYTRRLPVV